MLNTTSMDLPPIDEAAGASCSKRPDHPCDVDEWVYMTDSAFPRIYGRCDSCGTRYCVVLPRRFGYRSPTIEGAGQFAVSREDERDDVVINAAESVLRRSGNAQRLWFQLHERPLAITRDILVQIEKAVRDQAREELRPRERLLDELLELVRRRLGDLEAAYTRVSRRALVGAARKAADALAALRAAVKRERPELNAIRAERTALIAEIEEARRRARREPLPMPAGYTPPPVDARSVLCDALAPSDVVYALVDPRDPELVRYVGRTCDPVTRYRGHCTSGADAVAEWVTSLREAGCSPVMVLLERCDVADVETREAHWIHHYRDGYQADLNRSIPRRRNSEGMR